MRTEESILQSKLENMFESRKNGIGTKLENIANDYVGLKDYMVDLQGHQVRADLSLSQENSRPYLHVNAGSQKLDLDFCKHSVLQMSEKLNVQPSFMAQLFMATEEWKKALFVHNINQYIMHTTRENHLVRVIENPEDPSKGEMRAFLSDRYKRFDGYELLAQFITAAKDNGAEISGITYDPTRHWVEVLVPEIKHIETENNGIIPMVFGLRMANSDFGDGAYELKSFSMRVSCLNGQTSQSALRQIHIGNRLPAGIILSSETMELNTKAMAKTTQEVVKQLLHDDTIGQQSTMIKSASENEINMVRELKALPRVGMVKAEIEAVRALLITSDPDQIPEGKATTLKLAQAISYLSNESSPRRRTELHDIAGGLMDATVRN